MAAAQQFVPTPRNIVSVTSELFQGAEISFKKVSTENPDHFDAGKALDVVVLTHDTSLQTTTCETTEGVNSYSGYVTLPKKLLPDAASWDDEQAAHIFFWYFGE
jgi:hypothetical protein